MTPLVRLRGISKHYGGVPALTDVDLDVYPGEVHAILGENGAGKSTLMKLLAGVVQPSTGHIELNGKPILFASPRAAAAQGLVCMFQELSLIPDLSVAENMLLAHATTRLGFFRRAQLRDAATALARVGAEHVPLEVPVRALSLADRQLTEIAKALMKRPRLLILDEATSALTRERAERVFAVVREMRAEGAAILFISHRFAEVDALADRISVFRNGRHVETFAAGSRSHEEIVALMIGQRLVEFYPPRPLLPAGPGPAPMLSVRGLAWQDDIRGVDLDVRPGEIVGIGGLEGQGQQALMLALFGVLIGVRGEITIAGRRVRKLTPYRAKAPWPGLALVPQDRKSEGLILDLSIIENLRLASLDRAHFSSLANGGAVQRLIERLGLVYRRLDDPVSTLSGGNQQKVVLAKWLLLAPRCLLLVDPTRGIDVGAKSQIYTLLRELAGDGMAILLQSTDQEELVHLCDRVHVFYRGRVNAVLEGAGLASEMLIAACMNLPTTATVTPA
jgi:ribose transport system ATP-binding protein